MKRFGNKEDATRYFVHCIQHDKPYWAEHEDDPIIQTIMGSLARLATLVTLIKRFVRRGNQPVEILEIGSFCGASAVSMAKAIQRYQQGCGRITCIDPWAWTERKPAIPAAKFFDAQGRDIAEYTYEDMFRHNVRACGVDDIITPI
ncbi:MAG: hypothetical protein D6820_15065, partial [Lentisphaerae bacterium]